MALILYAWRNVGQNFRTTIGCNSFNALGSSLRASFTSPKILEKRKRKRQRKQTKHHSIWPTKYMSKTLLLLLLLLRHIYPTMQLPSFNPSLSISIVQFCPSGCTPRSKGSRFSGGSRQWLCHDRIGRILEAPLSRIRGSYGLDCIIDSYAPVGLSSPHPCPCNRWGLN